ncbi:hypothetical protein CCACVL1_00574, partial [Corchorus capsularis]
RFLRAVSYRKRAIALNLIN